MCVIDGISQGAHLLSSGEYGKLVSDYTISYPQRFIILTCSCGFGVELYMIWEPSLNILSCISLKPAAFLTVIWISRASIYANS
jgi:hypothetical protein